MGSRCLTHIVWSFSLAVWMLSGTIAEPTPVGRIATVEGTNRFQTADVLASVGLSLDQEVSQDELEKAIHYLQKCGAFSQVTYSSQASPDLKIAVHLKDNDHFIPAFFDNIVWFSDDELLEELHHRVPLFKGALPTEGTLSQQVSEALEALLLEHRSPHHVGYSALDFELAGSDPGQAIQESTNVVNISDEGGLPVHVRVAAPELTRPGPVEVIDFHVIGPTVRMRKIRIRGAKEPELTELRAVASDLLTQSYSRRSLRTFSEKVLKPVYLKRGYLKVTFADLQASPVPKASDENSVDVTLNVLAGKQYKWAGLEWSGATKFPLETLGRYIQLHRGQPADVVEFKSNLELLVEELYYSRGYVGLDVVALPQIDEQRLKVHYEVRVHEGPQYRVGQLNILGLDERDTARVGERLKLRSGDICDQSRFDRPEAIRSWSFGRKVEIAMTRNDHDKTVDIEIQFR